MEQDMGRYFYFMTMFVCQELDGIIFPFRSEHERIFHHLDGSPGFVVMGGDPCSKGCEFESQHHILDGHFIIFICCKNFNVCLKRQK